MAKLTRLFNFVDNKTALISPYNGAYRVYENSKEIFFYSYSKALLYLLNKDYNINFIDNNNQTK